MLHVRLHRGVVEATADQALSVENGVLGVHGHLVLGGITNQTLGVSEGDIAGGSAVTLVVGDDLHLTVLEHTHARVGGTQIDTHTRNLCHLLSLSTRLLTEKRNRETRSTVERANR
eukprot:comp11954_c0_seq1/m.6633 comp11954_c0_seq1/g.6633  ORF comp11954_c0_seq1/g.6633 comp11954_c0_seq1/m.6633 type:complete len:116 (+) comp11954_c0_seq1:2155-2502(+)